MTPDSGCLPGLDVALMPHQITGIAACLDLEKSEYAGGFLADDMGMGKTFQMVGTILKNGPRSRACKTTLIVAPLALIEQWETALEKVTGPKLTMLVYHGPRKASHAKTLLQRDIVITTYGTLYRQYVDHFDDSPLFQAEFYRVVLDESHRIRNRRSKTSQAACALSGRYRWCLSGTPIINRLWDFYAQIRFLRVPYYHVLKTFRDEIARFETKNPTLAVKRLQSIVNPLMIRRLKSDTPSLLLPEKKVILTRLEFSEEERQIYDSLELNARDRFNRLLDNDSVSKNMFHVLTLLLRLRQLCSHPALIKNHVRNGKQRDLKTQIDKFLKGNAVPEAEFEALGDDDGEEQDPAIENCDCVAPSTKMKFMMDHIVKLRQEHPTEKIIVISQWTQLLKLAAQYLDQARITHLRYQGDMNRTDRELAIREFMKEKGTEPVLLLSLLCGGTGLNLTRANHVICLDLGWSPAIENQAFDRVHRPGQSRPVFIHRIVIASTVEDRILALQERKQNLADGSLNEGNGKSLRSLSSKELATLFGLNLVGL
ncbi:SNF2 family N-terminal domain-containing protein [Mycena polygramma]|nr:SNF2 family N-terminal domain-containing protein [Mycena polygramma]